MESGISSEMRRIARLIGSARCALSTEKAAQADIEAVLRGAGLPFEREARLGPGDIPDFIVGGAIVIEVKLRSTTRKNIGRQLERYAAYHQVKGLLLVSNIATRLPDTINGKPLLSASLGAAWV